MKRNPVIPYAMIAVLGILAMIILSVIGLNQQEEIAQGDGEQTEEAVSSPEEIAQASCVSCHGGNLEGDFGPDLTTIGSKYTEEELLDIILNGIEGTSMPGGTAQGEDAEVLAEWLAEQK
ncbi:cytochrome c550 [Aquibacillus sediminis]|uniref:cytochrome c550 n=1 Tax=Aquibacillus sediminis TaxID=2574734 RepID=UPI0011091FC4|nr:cytochrome c [Aquibacillus sediminis]